MLLYCLSVLKKKAGACCLTTPHHPGTGLAYVHYLGATTVPEFSRMLVPPIEDREPD